MADIPAPTLEHFERLVVQKLAPAKVLKKGLAALMTVGVTSGGAQASSVVRNIGHSQSASARSSSGSSSASSACAVGLVGS